MREADADGTRALVALQRLHAAYGDAVTRRSWDDVRALFEPDATVHIDTRTRPPFELAGPDEVAAFIERALESFAFFEFAILNAVAHLDADDGDRATGRVYICELRHDREGAWTEAYGLYVDRYRRRDGTWRIAQRHYSSLARRGEAGIESFGMPSATGPS